MRWLCCDDVRLGGLCRIRVEQKSCNHCLQHLLGTLTDFEQRSSIKLPFPAICSVRVRTSLSCRLDPHLLQASMTHVSAAYLGLKFRRMHQWPHRSCRFDRSDRSGLDLGCRFVGMDCYFCSMWHYAELQSLCKALDVLNPVLRSRRMS